MSDQLSAAASALGIPESLVERSAAARAAESGSSTEDILAAWAGGEVAPSPTPARAPEETERAEIPDEDSAETPADQPPPPEIVIEAPAPAEPVAPAPVGPYKPPVLVGARDNPMVVLAAAVGLFVVLFLVGLVGPSFQGEALGARTSEIQYSSLALDGQRVYEAQNCVSCHTQMVRPVIADVGLGAVTVHDTNQVIGTRRFGPDLSNVGSRLSESQLEAIVLGLGEHPAYSLSSEGMTALVAYLSESRTAQATGG